MKTRSSSVHLPRLLAAVAITGLIAGLPHVAQADSDKVEVCHQTGNGEITIEVAERAVADHIANHGDSRGACEAPTTTTTTTTGTETTVAAVVTVPIDTTDTTTTTAPSDSIAQSPVPPAAAPMPADSPMPVTGAADQAGMLISATAMIGLGSAALAAARRRQLS